MRRTRRLAARIAMRPLWVLQVFLLAVGPGCVHPGAQPPEPGVLEFRAPLRVPVPGGEVDVAGGNLLVRRLDLSIDTRLGEVEIGAVYSSASRSWVWSFGMTYDGVTFVDDTGAIHDLSAVSDGQAVPGTHWVRVDASRVKTKGGRMHVFDPMDHGLRAISWGDEPLPALVHDVATVSGSVRPVRLSQCDGWNVCQLVLDIEYDENGCVSRFVDRAGREARFESDAACRVEVARDGLDVEAGWPGWRYDYEAGLLRGATSSEGVRDEYAYLDGRILLARRVAGGGAAAPPARVLRFDHRGPDGDGLFSTRVDDARGGRHLYEYDGAGRLHRWVDAVGDERTWTWSGRRPTRMVEADGGVTRWQYVADDPVTVELPTGRVLELEYAPEAIDRRYPRQRPIRSVRDALGWVEQRTYDARGRLFRVENGAGELLTYSHTYDGLLKSVTGPDGIRTELADHGEHGHPTRVSRGGQVDHRTYDAVGNQLTGGDVDDPLAPGRPGTRRVGFDADRNVTTVERLGRDALGDFEDAAHEIRIEWRSDGRPSRIQRPFGGGAELVYDAMGNLAERRERVDGVWVSTRHEYDVAGAPTAYALANGMRRELRRDLAGRVAERRLLQDGVLVQAETSTYAQGRLVERRDSAHGAPEQYGYDAAGRLTRVVHPQGEVVEIDYDTRSREVQRTYRLGAAGPALRTIERAYDGVDREIRISDQGEPVLTRTYVDGRVERVDYGNGLVRRYSFEPTFGVRLGSTMQVGGTGPLVEETRLGWTPCQAEALCVTSRMEVGGDGHVVPRDYTYEGYRLGVVPAVPTPEAVTGLRVEAWLDDDVVENLGYTALAFEFDALGNWLGVLDQGTPVRRFVFNDERNRLLSTEGAEPHTYRWDEAGFAVERDGEAIAWSPNGRPTALGERIQMQWDVRGRPIATTVDGVTAYARFGGEIVADASGSPLRLDLGEVVIDWQSGGRLYRHHDFRGNVQLVTDDMGQPVRRVSYAPFGPARTDGADVDDRSFAGGAEIGDLLMLGARLYDPAVGRFLSPDPIYQVVNQFAYTLGNPVFLWDPDGESARPIDFNDPQLWDDLADGLLQLALLFIGAGLALGNPAYVAIGFLFTIGSGVARLRARSLSGSSPTPRVEVHDVPYGSELWGGPGEASAEVPDVVCAPTAISGRRGVPWGSAALWAIQVLVALGLARWLRGSGSRT